MAETLTFTRTSHCIDHGKQNSLSPLWGLYCFIQFQGASPPAISCRPFRSNIEFPKCADETLRETSYEKLMSPLVSKILKEVKAWRDNHYEGASETSKALLSWWFKSIEDIHNRLKQKDHFLSLQIDVTAAPKHNNGAIFVQTVCNYPLVKDSPCVTGTAAKKISIGNEWIL